MRHRLVRLFRIVRIGPTLQRGGCIRQVPGLAQLPQFHFGEEDGSVLGHISARAAGEASDAPGHRAPMTPPARPLATKLLADGAARYFKIPPREITGLPHQNIYSIGIQSNSFLNQTKFACLH